MSNVWTDLDERLNVEEMKQWEQAYQDLMKLSYDERRKLFKQWEDYYKNVGTESTGAKVFFSLRLLMKKKRIADVHSEIEKLRTFKKEHGETFLKPSAYDPLFLMMKHKEFERRQKTMAKKERSKPFSSQVKEAIW